jgi:pyridoxal 5'-phosphate synthase pdxS subunit
VGSGIFKSDEPEKRAAAIVKAVTHYQDPAIIADVSRGIGAAMRGTAVQSIPQTDLLAVRGW